MTALTTDQLIDLLYIPESDVGFINTTLKCVRSCKIETATETYDYYSVVDIITLAGYKLASSNWRNILNVYMSKTDINVRSWTEIRHIATQQFLSPKFSTGVHGKTALAGWRDSIRILSRLPATSTQCVDDMRRIFREYEKQAAQLYLPATAGNLA